MSTFGRQSLITVGRSVKLTADGQPEVKSGGVTLDWATVATAVAASVLADGVQIAVGDQYLRYGQVITRITNPATDVVTLNNTPTGGTFTVSVTRNGATQTTAGIAYNATAATLQAAIRGLSNVGGTLATVSGSAGGPYTITFDNSLGAVTVAADGTALTGAGAQPTATVVSNAPGGDVGKYGPYDPAATDGRQTLAKGSTYLVNETVKLSDLHSDHPAVMDGGRIFKDRLIATTGSHSLAAGPTFAELEAVLPRLTYVAETQ